MKEITNFKDFIAELRIAGFSIGGTNGDGIFSLCEQFGPGVEWHTGGTDTDPWEWRMRVLDECSDIAYAKLFFKKSGFITKEWYPYFLAVRRGDRELGEEYQEGRVSALEKRIYEAVSEYDSIPVHFLKKVIGIGREDGVKFERALTELQMRMYITMCGRQRKTSYLGEEYGWASTVFCTTDRFFGNEVMEEARQLTEIEATAKILERIQERNPNVNSKKAMKFIKA